MAEPLLCPQCGSEIPSGAPAGLCPKCLVLAGLESQPSVDAGPPPTQPSPPAASAGFVPPTVEDLAAKFPQLEILGLLGKGGMGAVYKARQPGLDRLVAVKILPPEISADPAFAERFTREARALARLTHPNIVAVYDFGRTPALPSPSGRGAGGEGVEGEGLFYFVMEFVDGVNLRQAIQSGGMSPKEALAIVPQICDALQFAHDEGIVHRDIKPENILVDKRGRVKIADFGLAKLLGQTPGDVSLTGTQQVMGTLRYMAPEQLEGTKAVDHRADIYSLGVVFYELLTGELPIGRFAPPSKKVEIDVRLDEVVLRALEKEPELRYQHASELKTEVESVRLNPAPAKAFRPEPAPAPGPIAGQALGDAIGAPVNEPRLSRCALWGAIWAPFVLFVLVFAAAMVGMESWEYSPASGASRVNEVRLLPSWSAVLFMVITGLFALVGVMAPFGTTILGVVAIGQIRRSGNKLYGLPLAVFNALLFPMLVLDSIILTAVAAVTLAVLVLLGGLHEPLRNLVDILDEAITLGIGLPIIAWVDYRIARAVWRNATGHQAPPRSAAAIPSTPVVQTPGAPAQRVATGNGPRPPVPPAAPLAEIPPVRCSPWRRVRLLATLTVWTAVLFGGFGYFMPLIWNEWWPWVYKEHCEVSVKPQSGAYGTVHLRAERRLYCWGQHPDRPILKRPWVGTATIDLPGQGAAMTLEMDAFADEWRLTRPDGQEIKGPFDPPLRLVTPWMRDAGIDISKPGVREEAAALVGLVKDAAKGVLLGVAPSPDYLPPGGTKIGPFTVVGSLSWQRSSAEGAVGPVDRRLLAGALLLAIWLPGIPIIVRRHRRRLAAAHETEQRYRLGTIGFWAVILCFLGAAATSILPWVWLSSSSPTSMFRNEPMPDLGAFDNWYGAVSVLAFLTVLVLCFLTDFFSVRRSWQPRAMVAAGAIVVIVTGILFWRLSGPPATARVVTIDFYGHPQMVALVSTVGCWQEHELCRGSFPESSLPKTFDQQSGLGLQLAMALGIVLLILGCVTSWRARRRAAQPTGSAGEPHDLPPAVPAAAGISPRSMSDDSALAPSLRLSRVAVAAAIWAPFAFLFVAGSLTTTRVRTQHGVDSVVISELKRPASGADAVPGPPGTDSATTPPRTDSATTRPGADSATTQPDEESPGPAWWQWLLICTLLPLGITAPFGTTILGGVALTQIRHSAGRLYGLGLALFDTLLFPILVVDLVIWYGIAVVIREELMSSRPKPNVWLADIFPLIVAAVVIVVADALLIRLGWRIARAPLPGTSPPLGRSQTKGEV